MKLNINSRLHPVFAAEITGIDLRTPPPAELRRAMDDAMDEYAVVVVRDQLLDDEQHLAFARAMGPLEPAPAVVDAHLHRRKHREMVDISNLDVDGSVLAVDDRRRMFNPGNLLWHSDSSFKGTPAKYSMLHARLIPPVGGETQFADIRAAYDALPDAEKSRIETPVCDHSLFIHAPCWASTTGHRRLRSLHPCRNGWCAGTRDRDAAAFIPPRTSARFTACRVRRQWW